MAKFTFRRHKLAAAICTAALLMPVSVQAKRLTILYVPLDNRPVCSAYVKQTMEAANCKIILPPEKYIAFFVVSASAIQLCIASASSVTPSPFAP